MKKNHSPTEDIRRAEEAAGKAWSEKALEVIRLLALDQPELHRGQVWEYLEDPPSGEYRAIGGAFSRARRAQYIEKTDRVVDWEPTGEMTGNLGRTRVVWKSLIYEES